MDWITRGSTLFPKWAKVVGLGIVVLAATGYVTLQYVPPAIANAAFISAIDANKILTSHPDTLVLDVRTPGEYYGELGHLKDAVNIDYWQIPTALKAGSPIFDLPKSTQILIHCHTDVRASIASRTLKSAGFNNISVIDDGIVGWHKAKLPVVYSPPRN